LSGMADHLQILSPEWPAPSVDRERELTAVANRLVDAVYADCQGNLGEVAFVFSHALASVLRSWPHTAGRELLAKAARLLHATLWASCAEGPVLPNAGPSA